jgi:hypothetical protein
VHNQKAARHRGLSFFSIVKDPCFVDRNRFFNFEAPFQKADFQVQITGPPITSVMATVMPAVHPRIRPGKMNDLDLRRMCGAVRVHRCVSNES